MNVKLNGNDFFRVTCEFGSKDSLHPYGHQGIDLAMNTGTKLFSPVDGVISKVVDYGDKNVGKGIFIETEDHNTVIMGHLSDFRVSEGQSIHQGDLVALSGSTGRSTGSHLHLGLKDADGSFVDPAPLLNDNKFDINHEGIITKLANMNNNNESISFIEFINNWKDVGFWKAMYGQSFFGVMKDFVSQLLSDLYTFIISNGDLFFVLPAVMLMFATFFIGRNKYTKFIIPLWVAYFVSSILNVLNCLPPQ
jgi:hypothetical protein